MYARIFYGTDPALRRALSAQDALSHQQRAGGMYREMSQVSPSGNRTKRSAPIDSVAKSKGLQVPIRRRPMTQKEQYNLIQHQRHVNAIRGVHISSYRYVTGLGRAQASLRLYSIHQCALHVCLVNIVVTRHSVAQ